MQKLELWHNIYCSKSNCAKDFLDQNSFKISIRDYLSNPPSIAELEELLKKLNISIFELVRTGEEIYKELNLENIKDETSLIKAVLGNPILIQRPILVGENRAFIVRPPVKIEDILNNFV
ncbi:arsenate reductase (glutaredoxin) [Aliarcobacter trophiarum LMG 25534]|uniref:Arsenate reductase (ArsC) family protein n=1 Tax=Aliarcobacter trophiarum LMG 25534 TaxID=1032241 RepID=A0AAD0VLE1_9BACT|nr:ArsC/Spx/MgsR family protein [Aliarcobacter trophiarum]AXK48138.1 arsenate reductase (ArsC) family protein [Aliarcobacter trophiarum LMG 25534]RXJ93186.1 arsenate reductase (glutaredoxin) [Aliarcobacter trophiarum LMG 25534]